ncbi:MAG: hypothetical protein ACI4F7_02205 [Acutalibacteraceae bacterium]
MKKISKRLTIPLISVTLCIAIALGAYAATEIYARTATESRTVTVNTGNVIQDDFEGIGDNLWSGAYSDGMNDAYQKVNDSRTNRVQPAFIRLIFLPEWLVYLDEEPAVQQARYEAKDYNWDSLEAQNFLILVKMFAEAGTVVQLNMGGRVDVEHGMASWFSIAGTALSEGGTRGAPRNLEAFAEATTEVSLKVLEIMDQYGVSGRNKDIMYLSFYNEVNGQEYEAYANKMEYWSKMIELCHYSLKKASIRDKIEIYGVECGGDIDDPGTVNFIEYVKENLVDENGKPMYERLSTHSYPVTNSAETMFKRYKALTDAYPDIYLTEFSAGTHPYDNMGGDGHYHNFGHSEVAQIILGANAGFAGMASWRYYGVRYPASFAASSETAYLNGVMWKLPSTGMEQVSLNFATKSLAMRYIPKHSMVVETVVGSDDLMAATFIKDDQVSIFVESDIASVSRELTINVGNEYNGKTFERHLLLYPEPDSQGIVGTKYNRDPYSYTDEYGNITAGENALITPTDKYVKCENGKIVDTIPAKQALVVYTTVPEVKQVVLESTEKSVSVGGSVTFKVTDVYGADTKNVIWEVYGKCPASAIENNGGYGWETENCGSVDQKGKYTATGVSPGDCVALKVYPESDSDAYSVVIVNIES